jgi:CLIP-associating protein 1/2
MWICPIGMQVTEIHLHVQHFQRPLRKQVASRVSVSGRRSFDDGHVLSNDICGYTDGPASLNDALSEGLSPSSDWTARVAAFNCIQILLQQGKKGIQGITQNFEKVMKLFFRYLDDPHHKVALHTCRSYSSIQKAF